MNSVYILGLGLSLALLSQCGSEYPILSHGETTVNNLNDGGSDASADTGTGEGLCDNGVDDDGDGYADCADRDCQIFAHCLGMVELDCSDQLDNDGDGYVDCEDQDCVGTLPCISASEDCANGVDDNGNGLVDCDDPTCHSATECQTVALCDPVENTGCAAAGENCYLVVEDSAMVAVCTTEKGTSLESEDCLSSPECVPGLACVGFGDTTQCQPVCESGMDADCPLGSFCVITYESYGVCM